MLGDEMKRLRKRRKISQADLAEAMDVSQATIASWEIGARRPDIDAIVKMAAYFNTTTDDLLGVNMGGEQTEEERELWELREACRRNSKRKVLLDLAAHGTDREVTQTVAIADALRATNSEYYDGDDPA